MRGEDLVEFLAGQRLPLQRQHRQVVDDLEVGGDQRPGAAVGLAGEGHRRLVDLAAGLVGDGVVGGRQRDRRGAVVVERDPHPKFRRHLLADEVDSAQVVGGAGVGLAEHDLLGGTASQQGHDLVEQLVAGLQVGVLGRRVGDEAKRRPAGDDREDLRRVEAEQLAAERVAGLVVGDDPPLLRIHATRLLGADRLAQQRLVEVVAAHRPAAGAAGDDRALVERVGELGAGQAGRLAGDVGEVEVGG